MLRELKYIQSFCALLLLFANAMVIAQERPTETMVVTADQAIKYVERDLGFEKRDSMPEDLYNALPVLKKLYNGMTDLSESDIQLLKNTLSRNDSGYTWITLPILAEAGVLDSLGEIETLIPYVNMLNSYYLYEYDYISKKEYKELFVHHVLKQVSRFENGSVFITSETGFAPVAIDANLPILIEMISDEFHADEKNEELSKSLDRISMFILGDSKLVKKNTRDAFIPITGFFVRDLQKACPECADRITKKFLDEIGEVLTINASNQTVFLYEDDMYPTFDAVLKQYAKNNPLDVLIEQLKAEKKKVIESLEPIRDFDQSKRVSWISDHFDYLIDNATSMK